MAEPIDTKIIQKKDLLNWLGKLKDYSIIAPVRRDKYTEFSKINELSDISLGLSNTVLSPKNYILDQTKCMFKYTLEEIPPELQATITGDEADSGSPATPSKKIILGIRSCDAGAFAADDKTFDAEFTDPYYLSSRGNAILVGLSCIEPEMNCFCTSVGYNPSDGSNMDIMMVDLDDYYLFNIYTEKGQRITTQFSELFSEPNQEQLTSCNTRCKQAHDKVGRSVNTDGKPEKLGEVFESVYWEQVARKCLGCGICTYLCPTCYCFDITDEKRGTGGVRVRTWDSCMFPEYTVHASGYNPRPARMNRLRNRVYHKYKYYPDLYNMYGCTGCGRCIRYCPVNIDIVDIVNGVDDLKTGGEE
jgi:ferredoxin